MPLPFHGGVLLLVLAVALPEIADLAPRPAASRRPGRSSGSTRRRTRTHSTEHHHPVSAPCSSRASSPPRCSRSPRSPPSSPGTARHLAPQLMASDTRFDLGSNPLTFSRSTSAPSPVSAVTTAAIQGRSVAQRHRCGSGRRRRTADLPEARPPPSTPRSSWRCQHARHQCLIIAAVASHYPPKLRGASLGFALGLAASAPPLPRSPGGCSRQASRSARGNRCSSPGASRPRRRPPARRYLYQAGHHQGRRRRARPRAPAPDQTRQPTNGDDHDHDPAPSSGSTPPTSPASRHRLRRSRLYRGFEKELLVPLWTEIGGLMPARTRESKAQPHLWRWNGLLPLAERAGESSRSARAVSAGRSRWRTRPWVDGRSWPRRSGRRSST